MIKSSIKYVVGLSVLIIGLLSSQIASAQVTAEKFAALPETNLMAISPEGKKLAYRKTSDSQDIVVVYSLETNKTISAINVADVNPRFIYFISEGNLIIKARDVETNWSTAFVMDVGKGKVRQLLKPNPNNYASDDSFYHTESAVVGIDTEREHAFMPVDTKESVMGELYKKHLMKVPLNSRRSPRTVERGDEHTIDYLLNLKGEVIVKEKYNQITNQHTIISIDGDKEVEIYSEIKPLERLSVVGTTPDAQYVVVAGINSQTNRESMFKLSLKDGSFAGELLAKKDKDVEYALMDINRVIYGVRYAGFEPSYQFIDGELNKRVNTALKQLQGYSVGIESWTDDWSKIVILAEGNNSPGDYYLLGQTGQLSFIASQRPNIKPEEINPVIEYSYKAQDGLNIPALLTTPVKHAQTMKNMPAIVLPHGGPQSHDKKGFDWLAQALASQGYAVIQPQYRGSDGFGYDFVEAGFGQWGQKMVTDITDSIAPLVKQQIIDPDKICIVGASYGGYAALAAAAKSSSQFKCVVSINGVTDLNYLFYIEVKHYGKYTASLDYLERLVGKSRKDTNYLDSISPTGLAKEYTMPILLLHGRNDDVVEVEHSRRLRDALNKEDKNVKYTELLREDHYLSRYESRIEALDNVLSFIKQHVPTKI
ncbi:alpha/beta fold hydrolase [Catenovulum sp. SX2]|uniref:alpha/beta hydrolase family protein n=1 Tax=Catenovulum sp. SX2 TaxID=3398614 RepID=UPI003F870CA3